MYDGETIFFDGSASSDNDESGSSIVLYEWWINGVYNGGGSTKSYQFTLGNPTQTVKLRVKDDEAQWGENPRFCFI